MIERRSCIVWVLFAVAACTPAAVEPVPPGSPSEPVVVPTTSPPPQPTAAQPTAPAPQSGIDEVVFRFHDASVPPQFHRSYVIVATPTEIRKTVDSYGDVISDDRAPLTRAKFDSIVEALRVHGIKAAADGGASPGCTGGTARSLEVKAGGEVVLKGRLDRCGGKDSGTLAGDVDAFQKVIGGEAPGGPTPP